MDDLFANLGEETMDPGSGQGKLTGKKEARKEGRPEKDFTSDLQSFLHQAFEESFEEQLREEAQNAGKSSEKKSAASFTGLDALIRSTLEPASMAIDPKAMRRLVVTFNEAQLEKLRTIAKLEKTYLKKIINDIVEDFIKQYEKKNK